MEKEQYQKLNKVYKNSIVDNDFERVSNIQFEALDSISRYNLIEEVMRRMAIA